jgi:Fe2+ transport system protein FeoA
MPLIKAPVGVPLIVETTAADAEVAHRLATLGWRPGSQTRLLKHAVGGAQVVEVAGARVALAKKLCTQLQVYVENGVQ